MYCPQDWRDWWGHINFLDHGCLEHESLHATKPLSGGPWTVSYCAHLLTGVQLLLLQGFPRVCAHLLPQDNRSGPEAIRIVQPVVWQLLCSQALCTKLWVVLVKLLCEYGSAWPRDLMAPGLTEPGTSSDKSG